MIKFFLIFLGLLAFLVIALPRPEITISNFEKACYAKKRDRSISSDGYISYISGYSCDRTRATFLVKVDLNPKGYISFHQKNSYFVIPSVATMKKGSQDLKIMPIPDQEPDDTQFFIKKPEFDDRLRYQIEKQQVEYMLYSGPRYSDQILTGFKHELRYYAKSTNGDINNEEATVLFL